MSENIGAVARAMFNFGLRDLRIVTPRDGWRSDQALANAANAAEVIKSARVFTSLAEALHDVAISFASTARDRYMNKEVVAPSAMAGYINPRIKTALILGCERSGLSNDDAALANYLVRINVNPECSSMNIAMAAAILCYELYEADYQLPKENIALASGQHVMGFMHHLEGLLDAKDFFKSVDKKPTMIRNLRNIFKRIKNFTDNDIKSLYGVVNCLVDKKNN
jgi:tRNA/rRNA methyltransferase